MTGDNTEYSSGTEGERLPTRWGSLAWYHSNNEPLQVGEGGSFMMK